MPTVTIRYKPSEFQTAELGFFQTRFRQFVTERVNRNSAAQDHFEVGQVDVFFGAMDPLDVTPHAMIITIVANTTPEREEGKDDIAGSLAAMLVHNFPCDCVVKLYLVSSIWKRP